MSEKEPSIEELLADIADILDDGTQPQPEPAAEAPTDAPKKKPKKKKKKKNQKKGTEQPPKEPEKEEKKPGILRRFFAFLGKLLLLLLQTALLLAIALYGVLYVVSTGPSSTARDQFVTRVRETSGFAWVASIYFTDEEIQLIENREEVEEFVETEPPQIQIPAETEPIVDTTENPGPQPDAWGLIDEDGDGIILEEVKGEGYCGYMMVVLDPSRVTVGGVPKAFGIQGYTLEALVTKFDAVAGTNAGGFVDPEGRGNGSLPDSMVVFDGKVYYSVSGTRMGFMGFDSNHVLHVAPQITKEEIKEKDIRYGVCSGPVLISDGEACDVDSTDVAPRTAIGQRADGAILMLVMDGRQAVSLGATLQDLVDIMLDYGAVNACNLYSSSSTGMWYEDGYVNSAATVMDIRPVPNAILVLKEGEHGNG